MVSIRNHKDTEFFLVREKIVVAHIEHTVRMAWAPCSLSTTRLLAGQVQAWISKCFFLGTLEVSPARETFVKLLRIAGGPWPGLSTQRGHGGRVITASVPWAWGSGWMRLGTSCHLHNFVPVSVGGVWNFGERLRAYVGPLIYMETDVQVATVASLH